jgi:Papain-like cysteine protease AvrRpt2
MAFSERGVGMKSVISKRKFLTGMTALSLPMRSSYVEAFQGCPAPGMPPGTCSAWVDNFVSQQGQQNSQWCWAASISMICKHHGYNLSQASIVSDQYGGPVNMPGDDQVLQKELNKIWTDDDGKKFAISAKIFSAALGTADLGNVAVVNELKSGRPLLNGSKSHATVTVRVDYVDTGADPAVQRVHVVDPWPGAAPLPQMARFLQPDEMKAVQKGGSLRFLASVRISPV